MHRWLVAALAGVVLIVGFLFLLPNLVASQLNAKLGQQSVAELVTDANNQNAATLRTIEKPIVLIDIPAAIAEQAIAKEITSAAASLELPDGWRTTLVGAPLLSSLPGTLRGRAKVEVQKSGIGSATVELSVDAIPHVESRAIVLALGISSVSVDRVSVRGFRLPWPLPDVITETVQMSLSAINSRLKPVRLETKIPPTFPGGGDLIGAPLISRDSVAAVFGKRANAPTPAQGRTYEQEFSAAAHAIMAEYRPGMGVIALAQSENTLPNTSEALRSSSIAINLQHTEDLLGVDHTSDPAGLNVDLSPIMLATISADYFEREMTATIRNAIAKVSVPGVELVVKPESTHVKTLEGALEAKTSGSAKFLEGAVTIDFTLTAWGVLDPSMDGLRARYAVRDFQILRLSGRYNELDISLAVRNANALAALILKAVKELPETSIAVPALSLSLPKQTGEVRVQFENDNPQLQLLGRTVLLSPEHVIVMTRPSTKDAAVGRLLRWTIADVSARPPSGSDFQRLQALFHLPYDKIYGNESPGQISLGLRREGLARLINMTWDIARPSVVAEVHGKTDIPRSEIQAIPGNASCSSMCPSTDSCGGIGSCKIQACTTVVENVCENVCPGGHWNPICRAVCHQVNKQVCHEEDDNNCINRIQKCVSNIGTCAAEWASGLRPACEVAMKAIDATDFRGLAIISGSAAYNAQGQSLSQMTLAVSPDLQGASLQVTAVAHAKVGASINIVWSDFGNLLLCPSGTLSSDLLVAAPLQTVTIPTAISWSGANGSPLKASLSLSPIDVQVVAPEPPVVTLAKSNPGLLSCALGRAVVGLAIAASPHITADLLAAAVRKAVNNDTGAAMAAFLDGKYTFKVDIKPVTIGVPPVSFPFNDEKVELKPRLTAGGSLIYAQ